MDDVYFKLVSLNREGRYFSFNSGDANKYGLSLEYIVGKTTIPKIQNSKIFIFDSLENAKTFLFKKCGGWGYGNRGVKIFECYATNVIKSETIATACYSYYWNRLLSGYIDWYTAKAPEGTLVADSITILDEVYSKE